MLSRIRHLLRATDGLAAVEFAMIAPILVTMFLGSIELTSAMDCNQKVTGMASTAADLVAQETQVATADISNVFSAVNSIVYPFPAGGLQITISSIIPKSPSGYKVAWSCAQNATARVTGSTITVPTGVVPTGGSTILAEVTYPYTSPIAKFLTGTTNMTTSFYAQPRRSTTVTGPASCP